MTIDRTFNEYRILKIIKDNKGITMTEISKRIDTSQNHAAKMMFLFYKAKLVENIKLEHSRTKPLVITAKGRKLLKNLNKVNEFHKTYRFN